MLVRVYANEGKKFVLTEAGFEIGRVRAKYEENSSLKKAYEKVVPKKWLDSGWVKEADK